LIIENGELILGIVFYKAEQYGNPVLTKSFSFAVSIVKFYLALIKTNRDFEPILKQILRSGTSIGANITEAQQASSKRDFTHKMSVALKEAKETEYWLKLLKEVRIIQNTEIEVLYSECDEFIRLLTSILKTLKSK